MPNINEIQQLVGMGDESSRAMPLTGQGYLSVCNVKWSGDGDNSFLEMAFSPDERFHEILIKLGEQTPLYGNQDEHELESLLVPGAPTGAELESRLVPVSWSGAELDPVEEHELESRFMPRSLSGAELDSILDGFIGLHEKDVKHYKKFADKFGFLGLCKVHGLPRKHLPYDDHNRSCEQNFIEQLRDWRWLVNWVRAALIISAQLRKNRMYPNHPPKFCTQNDWLALDWDASRSEDSIQVPMGLDLIGAQNDAETLLATYVNYGLGWGDVKPFLDWSGNSPTVGFQGPTLWDWIARQLLFRIAGGEKLCEFCYKPIDTKRKFKYCSEHKGKTAEAIRKRRIRAQKSGEGN